MGADGIQELPSMPYLDMACLEHARIFQQIIPKAAIYKADTSRKRDMKIINNIIYELKRLRYMTKLVEAKMNNLVCQQINTLAFVVYEELNYCANCLFSLEECHAQSSTFIN